MRAGRKSALKVPFTKSVVTRLVTCLMIGGISLSVGLGLTELNQARSSFQIHLSHRVTTIARNAQALYRNLPPDELSSRFEELLRLIANDPSLIAIRITPSEGDAIEVGNWSLAVSEAPLTQTISQVGGRLSGKLELDHLTLVNAPFRSGEQSVTLELLIDGAASWAAARAPRRAWRPSGG